MSYFSQEIAAHHPFFVFQRHNGLEFPGDGLYFGFAEEMEETGSSLDRSGHVGFDLHLVGFVGYGCGDAAHGDAGDSGVGVAVQVGIAELLVLLPVESLSFKSGRNSMLLLSCTRTISRYGSFCFSVSSMVWPPRKRYGIL